MSVYYKKAKATIWFEQDHVACQYCPALETYARNQCRLTGEYLIDTRVTIGYDCPLDFSEEGEKND